MEDFAAHERVLKRGEVAPVGWAHPSDAKKVLVVRAALSPEDRYVCAQAPDVLRRIVVWTRNARSLSSSLKLLDVHVHFMGGLANVNNPQLAPSKTPLLSEPRSDGSHNPTWTQTKTKNKAAS